MADKSEFKKIVILNIHIFFALEEGEDWLMEYANLPILPEVIKCIMTFLKPFQNWKISIKNGWIYEDVMKAMLLSTMNGWRVRLTL